MKEEIRQDGRTILSSEDGFSIRMFFNNLSGKNFSGKEYRDYVRNIAFGEMGFIPGTIELYCDGKKVRTGTLPELWNTVRADMQTAYPSVFEASYHFYISPFPDFPFLPAGRLPFVPSHVPIHFLLCLTYGTPHRHWFSSRIYWPVRTGSYRYANRVRIWQQPSANRRLGYSVKSAAALPAFVVRFPSLHCSKIPIPAWESEAARTKGN